MRSLIALSVAALLALAAPLAAGPLDEMALDRWKNLREVERYQFQIAEKFYREQNWKSALAEYEKFLTLYEQSEAAPHAQLKWSLCQVQLKKLNTAISDGFQSVVDYWPDSPDAIAARFYIGRTYKDMGELKRAKLAYAEVTKQSPEHAAAAFALTDLAEIARIEQDVPAQFEAWKKLTFETTRNRDTSRLCVEASQQLATAQFAAGAFDDALAALATTYAEQQLPAAVYQFARGPISTLTGADETKAQGERLADRAVAYVRQHLPTETQTTEQKDALRQHWFYMYELHAASRRDDRVLETFQQMQQALGVDDVILGRLAAWHKSRGKFDDARQVYGRFADKIAAQGETAQSYADQGQFEQSAAAYRQTVALDPQNPLKWKPSLAYVLRRANKPAEAIAVYEELIADDRENPGRWRWEIGNTHRDAGEFKQAIGVYRQCENFPDNYSQMAGCHRRLKEYDEAVLLYNQILAGHPPSAAWALLQIGYTREEAGDQERAVQAFQNVCKRFPKDQYASTAHAHLQTKYKINITLGGAADE